MDEDTKAYIDDKVTGPIHALITGVNDLVVQTTKINGRVSAVDERSRQNATSIASQSDQIVENKTDIAGIKGGSGVQQAWTAQERTDRRFADKSNGDKVWEIAKIALPAAALIGMATQWIQAGGFK